MTISPINLTETTLPRFLPQVLAANLSTDPSYFIRHIDKEAIIKVIKREAALGLSVTGCLINANKWRHSEDELAELWNTGSCESFEKCVMGALACEAGYKPFEVSKLPTSVNSWGIEQWRAIWARFGLTPMQCSTLMNINDNTFGVDQRAEALIEQVYSFKPQAIHPNIGDGRFQGNEYVNGVSPYTTGWSDPYAAYGWLDVYGVSDEWLASVTPR